MEKAPRKMRKFIFGKLFRSERGTALAELAIVLPVLIVFIGAIFEVSRAYYIQQTLEYGVKEASKIGTHIQVNGTTLSTTNLQTLIVNSVKVAGVIAETGQFNIRYFTKSGTQLTGSSLPFDRLNNPNGSVDLVEVKIVYPGTGSTVNTPIPAVFNPGGVFTGSVTLTARSVFQIDG